MNGSNELPAFISMIRCSQYFNEIVSNPYFWKLRLENEHPLDVRQGKPENISYYEWYRELRKICPGRAACFGYIAILEYLKSKGQLPDLHAAEWAASFGQLKALQWISQQKIELSTGVANLACGSGNIEMVSWLIQQGIDPSDGGTIGAARNGISLYKVT